MQLQRLAPICFAEIAGQVNRRLWRKQFDWRSAFLCFIIFLKTMQSRRFAPFFLPTFHDTDLRDYSPVATWLKVPCTMCSISRELQVCCNCWWADVDALKNRDNRRALLQKVLLLHLFFPFILHLNCAHHTSVLLVSDCYCCRTVFISLNSGRFLSIVISAVTLTLDG